MERKRKEEEKRKEIEKDILRLQRQELISQRELQRALETQRQNAEQENVRERSQQSVEEDYFRRLREIPKPNERYISRMSTQSDPVLQIRPDVTELRPAENGSLSQIRLEAVDTSRPLLPLQGQSQRTLDIDGSVQYEVDRYDVTNLDHVDMDLDDTTRRPQTFDPNGLGASREISSVNVSQSRNVVDRMESVEADVVNTSTEENGRIGSARQMHSTPKPESLSSFDRDMLEIDRRYAALSNPSSILKDQTRKKEFF